MKEFCAGVAAGVLLLGSSDLAAANGTGEASAATVGAHLALLVFGLLCFAVCFRIYSLLRGGELSTGWQVFTAAFLLLSLAEAMNVSTALEFFTLPGELVNALRVLALFLLFWGVTKIKKSLS
ncbi:MAG: hypothetical protein ABIJ61_14205 [bacterium]